MHPLVQLTALLTTGTIVSALPGDSNRQDRHHGTQDSQSCTSITADGIAAMSNNSLFTRWRPQSHFLAPAGWMNDPCGAVYDPTRDEYHLSYQWHPEHFNWGNISWGSATSKDLVTWTDHGSWKGRDALILCSSGNGSFPKAYDGLGIFSGTVQPVNPQGEVNGDLLAFYTSVSYLPTNWQIPYHPHTESQSLAISHDGGETWEQYVGNPVINATTETAPMDWNVTGFRDPFFEPLPELDAVLGVSEPHYYAVFGSGIKGVGPRMPLWTAPASDLTKWTFLGALWEPAKNTSLGPVLSTGSYAFNFEVSGFFPLPDSKGDQHWFVNMGTEGGNVSFHQSAQWALWNGGEVSRRENGSALFTPSYGGAGDWGLGYALSSFNDTKHNRRVQYAWIKEDLVGAGGLFSAQQQGFQGALSLPRELFVHEVENVKATTELKQAMNSVIDDDGIARTLGVKPLCDIVEGLRSCAKHRFYSSTTYHSSTILAKQASSHMELKATISSFTGAFGLRFAASPDGQEYTTVTYQPTNHTILVERLHSSNIVEFNNATITGYFNPYTVAGKTETITMDVFLDGSVAEIYVNERFALSARIYPSKECSTGYGVYVDDGASAAFESIEAWVGTKNVWPDRPLNSSSQLIWDTAAQTNDYTWWSGN
ncbi:glycoside hydrolase family 32 protein [Dothistroma septosporum NZE10]|uniref:Glycoside hydrolase family 32 protein n=1 Tax=Dothistroma septosporum (strain NZE10 / CBS 128990) TaxID=675120 RepID=N1PCP7_DOTSN|nr:glycoside hydrolase family 32 protein [Dothistroma septosporum NZE10]